MNKRHLLLIIALIIINPSCNDDETENPIAPSIDQKALAQELYNNIIKPDLEEFVLACTDLEEQVSEFRLEPTLENLALVKNSWLSASVRWKYCHFYNIGDVEDSFLSITIHPWPAQETFIENFISGEEGIDNDFVASVGSSSKGFAGMEYLLFSAGAQSILELFTTDDNRENRLNYLTGIAADLTSRAQRFQDIWTTQGYAQKFVDDANFDFNGSLAEIVNQMIATLEVMDIRKMTKAMGQDEIGVISTSKLESPYGNASQAFLLADLDALSRAFSGDPAIALGGPYLFDYLNSLNINEDNPLSERITESIAATRSSLQSIPENFSTNTALASQEALDALDEVRRLTILLKPELSSRLNVIVTPNPSDGD